MSMTPCSTGPDLPVKRKRGRPRKDECMARNEKRQIQTSIPPSQPPHTTTKNSIGENHNMVGQVVSGVIEGVFDVGYLISIRVGPKNTILRGLVFQQGHFCPITPANDVTPHLKMCRRESFQIPQVACIKPPQQEAMQATMQNYQTTPMMAGGSGNSTPQPPASLRMAEQDELMQVLEVSKMVEEQIKNINDYGHELKNDHLLSDSDLMADQSLPSLHCVDHEADKRKQEGESVEPGSFEKEKSEKQEAKVSKIDVNQDPNQEVDLVAPDHIANQD